MHPTTELYSSLQLAFEHFNLSLFDGKLEKVIFTVQRKKGVMGYFAPDRWGNLKGVKCHEIAINPSYIANARLIEVMQTLVHEMVHCWQYSFGNAGRIYYHNKEWAFKMIEIGLMPTSTGEPGGNITGQNMGDYIIENGKFLEAFEDLASLKKFQLAWIDRKALPRLFEPLIADPTKVRSDSSFLTPKFVKNNPEFNTIEDSTFEPHSFDPSSATFSDIMPENFFIPEVVARQTRSKYTCPSCAVKIYGKAHLNIKCVDCDQLFIFSK